jgi:caspase domain-containing protein/Sel1 repeat-containing protein
MLPFRPSRMPRGARRTAAWARIAGTLAVLLIPAATVAAAIPDGVEARRDAKAGEGQSPDRPSVPNAKETARLKEVSLCDCLLPPQIRRIGSMATYGSRPRAVRTTVRDCEIRGGEYVLEDRADYRSALKVWLPEAEAGDAEAQQNVGQIYEKGLGTEPNYAQAAEWYVRAAQQGLKSAQVSLGYLYERGLGVPRDTTIALYWYRQASDLPKAITLATVEVSATRRATGAAASAPVAGVADPGDVRQAQGPVIEIIEPRQTRGLRVNVSDATALALIGKATSPQGIFSVLVNGAPVSVDANGLFRRTLNRDSLGGALVVIAVDGQGRRSELTLPVEREESPLASIAAAEAGRRSEVRLPDSEFGHYTALVIANNEYAHLPDLVTPAHDADAIADVLRTRYGFKVRLLFNATMYDVLSALNELRKTLNKDDNLLIYYAGHGQLDQESMSGYWLTVDAELDSDANWIPTSRISGYLQVIPAKQILIISDSCFSGALTRSSIAQLGHGLTPEEKTHWYHVMAHKKARIALTSGGLTPVMDAGGGDHSVFNKALTEALAANGEVLEAQRLYRDVAARVATAAVASGVEQEPECAPIRHAGHEAGDFLFVPKASSTSVNGR